MRALLAVAEVAEVLVVGWRGKSAAARFLLGSTSDALARHASCPVVVVHAAQNAGDGDRRAARGDVVVGVDGSDASAAAVEFACNEAAIRGIGLTAVHAFVSPTLGAPAFGADSIAAGQLNAVLQAEEHIEAEPPPEVINGWLSNAAREYADVRVTTRLVG